jgi:hypothetical protein
MHIYFKENVIVYMSLLLLLVCQFFVFAVSPESKFVWVYTLLISLVVALYYRNAVPVLIIFLFFIPYFFIPKYFFWDQLPISFWSDYQDAYLINFVSVLNSIFVFSLMLGLGSLNDKKLLKKKIWGSLKDQKIFYLVVIILIFILIFGVQGESVFESGRYGTGDVSKSALHEYFIVFFVIALFLIDKNSTFQKFILLVLLFLYTLKTLLYGGRIEIVQLWLVVLYLVFNFFYKKKIVLIVILIVSYIAVDVVGQIRANPLLVFDLGGISFFGTFNYDSRLYISNQFGDVYQSSLRVIGLLNDGIIDELTRVESFLTVFFGAMMPSSLMPDFYNLSSFRRDVAMSGGGGLISVYSYAWLSLFGPIAFGVVIGLVIRGFYSLNHPYINVYGLLVLVSFPRWFAYYPVVLFKMCLLGLFISIFVVFLKRNTIKNMEKFE